MTADVLTAAFVAAVLAVLGSFIGLVAARFDTGEGYWGRSRCDACRRQLKAWNLIPLFSWAVQRGACAYCGAPIGLSPLIFETLPPAVFLALLWAGAPIEQAAFIGLLAGLAYGVFDVDWRTMLIPDAFTAAIALLGAAQVWRDGPAGPVDALAGAAMGGGLLWLVRALYSRARGREGLGLGDVKLAAAAGIWTGASAFSLYLFLASLLGFAVAGLLALRARKLDMQAAAPFGPALAAALVIVAAFRQLAPDFWIS